MDEAHLPHDLLDDVTDVFYVLDRQSRCTFANRAALRAWGVTKEELLGRALTAALPDAISSQGYLMLQAALAEQRVAHFETYSAVLRRWVDVAAYPHRGGLLVYLRDVHERRQVEEHARALAALGAQLGAALTPGEVARIVVDATRAAAGAAAVEVALLDATGMLRPALAAGAAHEPPGLPLDEPLPLAQAVRSGQGIYVHSRAEAAEHHPALLAQPEHQAWVSLPLVLAGRSFGALGLSFATPRLFDHHERSFLEAVAALGAQALERARLHDQLLAEERQTAGILENISDAFYTLDDHGRFTYVNRQAELFWGRSRDELLGKVAWQVFPRSAQSELLRAHLRATRRQQVVRLETDAISRTGWVDLSIFPTGAGLSVYFRDVTDRKRAEQQLRDLNATLEQRVQQRTAELVERTRALEAANEELEAFAYSVSHDLRTPVRHITAFNHLLRRALAGQLTEQVRRYLDVVEQAAGRMNVLIDALLDLSRTTRAALAVTPVDLGALVRTVREELELDLQGRVVRWELRGLPVVPGDPEGLRQVMTNLLGNAVKFTRVRDEAVIEVWAEQDDHAWVVFVRDNGVGFDPRYTDKLFGAFQRLHRHDEFEGVGVGLANVRRIVLRHGGRVWASGRPGEGATFAFSLPAARAT